VSQRHALFRPSRLTRRLPSSLRIGGQTSLPWTAIFALTTLLRQSQTRMVPCTAVVTALEPSRLNENETDATPRGRPAVTARHRWHDPSRSVGRSCDWLLSVAALAPLEWTNRWTL
jgi:hypothetical protein